MPSLSTGLTHSAIRGHLSSTLNINNDVPPYIMFKLDGWTDILFGNMMGCCVTAKILYMYIYGVCIYHTFSPLSPKKICCKEQIYHHGQDAGAIYNVHMSNCKRFGWLAISFVLLQKSLKILLLLRPSCMKFPTNIHPDFVRCRACLGHPFLSTFHSPLFSFLFSLMPVRLLASSPKTPFDLPSVGR